MTTALFDRIVSVIDKSLIDKFDFNIFSSESFVPVCLSKGEIYCIVTQNADKENVKRIIENVLKDVRVKFKTISDDEFSELISYIDKTYQSVSEENPDVSGDDSSDLVIKYDEEAYTEDDAFSNGYDDGDMVQVNPDAVNKDNKYFGKKLGEILIQMGVVSEEQIFNALVKTKKSQLPLGTILVQQGIIRLDVLKKALSAQSGFDAVVDENIKISEEALSVLPEDFIRINKVLPISYNENELVVGMVNPNDRKVLNDIIFLTSMQPKVLLLTHYEFQKYIQQYFSATRKETKKMVTKIERSARLTKREETLFEQAARELKDDSNIVVQFVNKMLSDGIDMKASDIHIEPRLEGYVVRYRKDGILRKLLKLPTNSESAVLTRFKVMSKMNIAEHRRPQDGSFSITYKEKDYDFRINTLPVGDGEKMVIRILAPAVSLSAGSSSGEDKLISLPGASAAEIDLIRKMESVPNGIILTTGPTGSGKTTTLYTLLKAINDEKINITTIEDPIEIRIDGINQSQINTKAGITFASCMRAILRQDPDVILVGEIRDIETLETAISAALTGHLVLSTLHTNSAASTITRLIDMGAKDYLVSSTLVGIIAQRLVRNLCPHCRGEYYPSREEAELVIPGGEREIQEFMKTPVYKPNGCEKCNYEGYIGRIGIYEIMPITKEIKRLIAQGAHDIQIEEAAIGSGMKTLHQVCLRHIIEGKTSIAEFLRVIGPVKE